MKWSLCRWNKVCHNTLVIHQPALFNKQFRPSETRCSFWGMFVVGGFLFVCCLCFSFQTHRGLSKFWVNNDSLQCKSNCNNTNAVSEFPNNTSHLCHSWPFVKKKKSYSYTLSLRCVSLDSGIELSNSSLLWKMGCTKSQRVISHHVFKGETNQPVYKAMNHDD